jgi:hypothetical protein
MKGARVSKTAYKIDYIQKFGNMGQISKIKEFYQSKYQIERIKAHYTMAKKVKSYCKRKEGGRFVYKKANVQKEDKVRAAPPPFVGDPVPRQTTLPPHRTMTARKTGTKMAISVCQFRQIAKRASSRTNCSSTRRADPSLI